MARARKPEPRPRNRAEALAWETLTAAGWNVTRRAWPDLLAWSGRRWCLVYCHRRNTHRPRYLQAQLIRRLCAAGVHVYRYDPEDGFQRLGLPAPLGSPTPQNPTQSPPEPEPQMVQK